MRHQRIGHTRRLMVTGTALAMLLIGLMASPALADQPTEWTLERVVEGGTNPCDPSTSQTVYLVFHVKEHQHENNVVLTVTTEVSTDDGFSALGHETRVITDRTFRTMYNFMHTNPETGQKFSLKGRIVQDLTTGEVLVDEREFYCVRS